MGYSFKSLNFEPALGNFEEISNEERFYFRKEVKAVEKISEQPQQKSRKKAQRRQSRSFGQRKRNFYNFGKS